jgi:NAD(P)H dehydrogenase (quinone)
MQRESQSLPYRVLIVYYSRFGVLQQMAEAIAEGVRNVSNVTPDLLRVPDAPIGIPGPGEDETAMLARRAAIIERFASADAIIAGSPSYFGSMASPIKRLFEDCATAPSPIHDDASRPWRAHLFRDKVGAAFTASATPHGGNEQTLLSMLVMMMHFGMVVVTPGHQEPLFEQASAPYGATTVAGAKGARELTESERIEARTLGQRVAEMTVWLCEGRQAWMKHHHLQEYHDAIGVTPRPRITWARAEH